MKHCRQMDPVMGVIEWDDWPLQRCGHASYVGSMTVRDGRRQWKRCDLAKAAVRRLWSPS